MGQQFALKFFSFSGNFIKSSIVTKKVEGCVESSAFDERRMIKA